MNLYLHIGTEKTGSSLLQSIAALNRWRLKDYGFWFPYAGKWEKEMQAGRISAGNAQHITDALTVGRFKDVRVVFENYAAQAKKEGCNSVLLSNEMLLSVLSQPKVLAECSNIFNACGFNTVRYLLILRDPVDQALSLYKHRAKGGTAPDIEDWPEQQYHYGRWLLNFLQLADSYAIDLTCRRFDKTEGYLETIFFKEWLNCKADLIKPERKVNPSLTISELLFLKKIRERHRYLPEIIYERLLALPKHEKAKEPHIKQHYRTILADYLTQYTKTWQQCNRWLSENEQIEYPSKFKSTFDNENKVATLSDRQLEELSHIITNTLSLTFKSKLYMLRCKRLLGRLKGKIKDNHGKK